MEKETLDEIFDLVRSKRYNDIKQKLISIDPVFKGDVFEKFVARLYTGNGWLAKQSGGRNDGGADVLLYHPENPSKVAQIIQTKNFNRPLNVDETKIELIKFEDNSSKQYDCNRYELISINGYVKEAKQYGQFNLNLRDWSFVEELISNYSEESNINPEVILFSHNQIGYDGVKTIWKNSNVACVVQATGTGKSFIIAKALSENYDKDKILLAPSNYILSQFKNNLGWLINKTELVTYAKLSIDVLNGKIKDYDLIILDEFHRAGAEVWGEGVDKLIAKNNQAKILGTTATPIRHLDASRDMSDELFEGNVANNISLCDAIVRKILPRPVYVSSLYTLEEETSSMVDRVMSSKLGNVQKAEILESIKSKAIKWELDNGIPVILNKYLKGKELNKFVVFCRNKEHLDEMEWLVQGWFQKAKLDKHRKVFKLFSGYKENNSALSEFKNGKNKDTIYLLFTIDMLNEGVHIKDVDGVLLLRPTASPTIFYQQIGRCIEVGKESIPIVFDFVNNFRSIRANDFLRDFETAKSDYNKLRENLGLSKSEVILNVQSHTEDVIELFDSIDKRIAGWNVMYEKLKVYKAEHGDCNVPSTYTDENTYKYLGSWIATQRAQVSYMANERKERLNAIGFIWEPHEQLWNDNYAKLKGYFEEHSHTNVSKKEDPTLASWVITQRKNKSMLSDERIRLLQILALQWNPLEENWLAMLEQLKSYLKKYGSSIVPRSYENKELVAWVSNQKTRFNSGKLEDEKVKMLNEIGFIWDTNSWVWNKRIKELKQYKIDNGDYNVPYNYKENEKLGRWVTRTRRVKDKLKEEQVKELDDIGFNWTFNKFEQTWAERVYQLKEFKDTHGHLEINASNCSDKKFLNWIRTQRNSKVEISAEKIFELDEIGFIWDTNLHYWNLMLAELVKFKQVNGHCKVPSRYKENPKLGTWLRSCKQRKSKLSVEQINQLTEIGITW